MNPHAPESVIISALFGVRIFPPLAPPQLVGGAWRAFPVSAGRGYFTRAEPPPSRVARLRRIQDGRFLMSHHGLRQPVW